MDATHAIPNGQHFKSERARYAAAASAGEVNTAVVWAGEGVDLVQTIEPAAAIVERVVAEAGAVLDRIGLPPTLSRGVQPPEGAC